MTSLLQRLPLLICLLVLCGLTTRSSAQESRWVGWLGQDRSGIASGFQPPKAWPQTLTQRWQVDVGQGYGSPLVSGDRVYVHGRQGDEEILWCLQRESGEEIWKKSQSVPFKMGGGGEWHGKGPKSCPLLVDDRVLTLSITGVLTAYSADSGNILWSRDPRDQFEVNHPYWGVSTSPIADQERVFVHFGNDDRGELTALDLGSGETIWRQGTAGTSYSSPLVTTLQGVRQVIEWNHDGVAGIDASSGQPLWFFSLPHVGSDQNMPTPTLHDGHILVGGENRGIRSLKPTRVADGWTVTQLWHQEEVALDMSTAVISAGRLIGFSHYDSGRLFALDPESGNLIWRSRPRQGSNVMFLTFGDRVAALMDRGSLRILDASADDYSVQATYQVSDLPTWAPPVLIDNQILIKDRERMTLFELSND